MAIRLFEEKDHAAAYLRYRVAPQEVIDRIVSHMEKRTPKQFDLAVDVGCGSGQGTAFLAPYFTRVVGLDISLAMLEMARLGCPPNVSYSQSPAEELPFSSGEVDLLMSVTAAHWFDRPRFLLEADRVLRPGGCLAVLSYMLEMELEYGDVSDALNAICEEFYAALQPFRHPYITHSSRELYQDMFRSCSYPDKEWNDCFRVKRTVSLDGYINMVQTVSTYRRMLAADPVGAERLSNDIRSRLLSAMNASSADAEVTMVVKYFYWLAHKP